MPEFDSADGAGDIVGAFTYAKELVSGAATLLEDAPAVGVVCKTFLAFESLVERAKSNKDELVVLLELCRIIFKGILERRLDSSGRTALHEGLDALARHVERAKVVANMCSGKRMKRLSQLTLSRKISKEIAAVRRDVLDFSAAVNVVINKHLHVSTGVISAERAVTPL